MTSEINTIQNSTNSSTIVKLTDTIPTQLVIVNENMPDIVGLCVILGPVLLFIVFLLVFSCCQNSRRSVSRSLSISSSITNDSTVMSRKQSRTWQSYVSVRRSPTLREGCASPVSTDPRNENDIFSPTQIHVSKELEQSRIGDALSHGSLSHGTLSKGTKYVIPEHLLPTLNTDKSNGEMNSDPISPTSDISDCCYVNVGQSDTGVRDSTYVQLCDCRSSQYVNVCSSKENNKHCSDIYSKPIIEHEPMTGQDHLDEYVNTS